LKTGCQERLPHAAASLKAKLSEVMAFFQSDTMAKTYQRSRKRMEVIEGWWQLFLMDILNIHQWILFFLQ
jgi:hypothetical protein